MSEIADPLPQIAPAVAMNSLPDDSVSAHQGELSMIAAAM